MSRPLPYAGTDLATFVAHRVGALRGRKSQADIAAEAGYVNSNVMSMIKSGSTKVALDRIPALALALECDAARLFQMALMQSGNETAGAAIKEIFGSITTRNEALWLAEIREASNHSDPALTSRARTAIRGVFGK